MIKILFSILLMNSQLWGADMTNFKKQAEDIKNELNSMALSPIGYFTIQHMLLIKSGETATLSADIDQQKMKWVKTESNGKTFSIKYNGIEAILSGPKFQSVDLLKLEGKKYDLGNGLYARVSLLKKVDLKVWLHNAATLEFKNFKGLEFFPFDEKGVIKAEFDRMEKPEPEEFLDSRDENGLMFTMGKVHFNLKGKKYTFKVYSYGNSWEKPEPMMIFIKDLSSGKTTYGAGRVVEIDPPKDPKNKNIDINFNRAYAFLCAHSIYYNCPLVLSAKIEDHLEFGEKLRAGYKPIYK